MSPTPLTVRSTTLPGGRSSSGRLPSYSEMATRLGLVLCVGGSGCPWYQSDHNRGLAVGHTIHWRDRRPSRPGIRQFLKAAAGVTSIDASRRGERFVRLYWLNYEIDRLAKIVGIRLPRSLADGDRAKVRFWLAKFRNHPLDREFPEQRQLMRRIQRWSRAR